MADVKKINLLDVIPFRSENITAEKEAMVPLPLLSPV